MAAALFFSAMLLRRLSAMCIGYPDRDPVHGWGIIPTSHIYTQGILPNALENLVLRGIKGNCHKDVGTGVLWQTKWNRWMNAFAWPCDLWDATLGTAWEDPTADFLKFGWDRLLHQWASQAELFSACPLKGLMEIRSRQQPINTGILRGGCHPLFQHGQGIHQGSSMLMEFIHGTLGTASPGFTRGEMAVTPCQIFRLLLQWLPTWSVHGRSMMHSWPTHDPFMINFMINSDQFMTKSWFIRWQFMISSWSKHDQFMTSSWPIHEQFMIVSWSVQNQITINSWSRSVHDQFMTDSWSMQDRFKTSSWPVREKFMAQL